MEYDSIDLSDHPICLFELIPATIVTLSAEDESQCTGPVEWRRSAREQPTDAQLVLEWDLSAIRLRKTLIDRTHTHGTSSDERDPFLTEPIRSELFQHDDERTLAR